MRVRYDIIQNEKIQARHIVLDLSIYLNPHIQIDVIEGVRVRVNPSLRTKKETIYE